MVKHLLTLLDFSEKEIKHILDLARKVKAGEIEEKLENQTLAMLFEKPSTRTRVSFEIAAKRLSADVINILTETSSVKKGETLIDTGLNIQALKTDIIVVRHNCSGAAAMLAHHVDISVVNAGDGWHEHPTQALLDLYTMLDKRGQGRSLRWNQRRLPL